MLHGCCHPAGCRSGLREQGQPFVFNYLKQPARPWSAFLSCSLPYTKRHQRETFFSVSRPVLPCFFCEESTGARPIAPLASFAYPESLLMCSVNYTAQPVAAVAPPVGGIFNPASLWRGAILGLLISWLYAPILVQLAAQWWHDPNFSHGFLVPLFSLFLLWKDRVRILKLSAVPSSWGLLIIIFALCLLLAGVLGAELFLSRISLLVLLAGLIIFFRGWPLFRAVLFPWAFLFLMIPIPAIIFNQITFPLQLLASKLAASILPLLGVPVLREGNIINLPALPLEVAEACSGIRSLLSLATLAVVYGYLMEPRVWIRVLLALASIPIAVVANSLRIVGTGLLVQYFGRDAAEGFFHTFSGWLVFVVSLFLLFAVHQLIVLAAKPMEEKQ